MKAVVFVDVQEDFVTGVLGSEAARAVAPKIVRFARRCAAKGFRLYATMDTHGEDYMQTLEGKNLPVRHCVEQTDGWYVVPELRQILDGRCTFVQKPTFGSFDLADVIREDAASRDGMVQEIVLVGFCSAICVLANAVILRARFPNVRIAVYDNLCACVSDESHEAAMKVLRMQQVEVRHIAGASART